MNEDISYLCWGCGLRKFPAITPNRLTGITIRYGSCPSCGEEKGLIPLSDWRQKSAQTKEKMD